MHSLLTLLFSCCLAGLVYGLSLLPTASLDQPEETEEFASGTGQESAEAAAPDTDALLQGVKGRARDVG